MKKAYWLNDAKTLYVVEYNNGITEVLDKNGNTVAKFNENGVDVK